MYELLLQDGALAWPLGGSSTRIGRGTGCEVSLPDPTVSTLHAALWTDSEVVFVQDLGSRNGTFVNQERVQGIARAKDGDALRFGNARALVRRRPDAVGDLLSLVLEDLSTGVRVPLFKDRLSIGSGPSCDLRLPDGPDATLLAANPEDLGLGIDDDVQPIYLDVPFSLGERQLCVRAVEAVGQPTREIVPTVYPYLLTAALEGGPGPYARLRHGERVYTIEAENRATLLWLLARKRVEDLAADQPLLTAGWCEEEALMTGIWGRSAGASAGNLRVLACRLRKELREAGFDPWFLETKAGYMRVRVLEIELL